MSKCHGCGSPLRFVKNDDTGKRIPVDPAPDESGNVIARAKTVRDPLGTVVSSELHGHPRRKGEDLPDGWALFMPHYATCRARITRGRGSPRPRTLFDDMETETR